MWSRFDIEVCKSVIPHPYELMYLGELEFERAISIYACIVKGRDGLRIRENLRRMTPVSGLYPLLTDFDSSGWDIPWLNEKIGRFVQETTPVNPDSIEYFWQSFQSELPDRLLWMADHATNAAMHADTANAFQALETLNRTKWGCEYEHLLVSSGTESVSPFAWHLRLNSKPFLAIVLLPIREPWHVASFASHISGNREHGWAEIDCPEFSPQMLRSYELAQMSFDLMVCKHWWNRYRAELVFSDGSSLHWKALQPPRTFEAAFQLAKEQYLYCNDAVAQRGWLCENYQTITAESIFHLAKILQISDRWSLWWD